MDYVLTRDEMNEKLTIDEIRTRYPSEWVLLDDPQVGDPMEILGGTVVIHSKNRDEVDRKAIASRLKRSAFIYTGTIPEDAVIIL